MLSPPFPFFASNLHIFFRLCAAVIVVEGLSRVCLPSTDFATGSNDESGGGAGGSAVEEKCQRAVKLNKYGNTIVSTRIQRKEKISLLKNFFFSSIST